MIEAKLNINVLYVKGCLPHYRRPLEDIIKLRSHIATELQERGVSLPIGEPVHLRILARRHTDGGDLSNIIQAVCQALDGDTLDRKQAPLVSDSQILTIHARWIQ